MVLAVILFIVFTIAIWLFSIRVWFAKKPVNIWANAEIETKHIADVHGFNHRVAVIIALFGVVFATGAIIFLVLGQQSPVIIFWGVGLMIAVIALLISYQVITNKFEA